jgi:hypothetical protein
METVQLDDHRSEDISTEHRWFFLYLQFLTNRDYIFVFGLNQTKQVSDTKDKLENTSKLVVRQTRNKIAHIIFDHT